MGNGARMKGRGRRKEEKGKGKEGKGITHCYFTTLACLDTSLR